MSTPAASARPDAHQAESVCVLRTTAPSHARERGLLAVVALTAVMMVVEIGASYTTHSMALTAVATGPGRTVEVYRAQVLAACTLCHLTIEVRAGV